jgi:hypothetical protein
MQSIWSAWLWLRRVVLAVVLNKGQRVAVVWDRAAMGYRPGV